MSYLLPSISKLPNCRHETHVEVLEHLFERCPTLNEILLPKLFNVSKDYASYSELIEKSRSILLDFLRTAEERAEAGGPFDTRVDRIIAAHPRLGPSREPINLSAHSSSEQKSLQSGSAEEAQQLEDLNKSYEMTFPNLRYVVFVNGRPRSEIMRNMRERIQRNDIQRERYEAINAMCDIALDRASKLLHKL